MLSAARFVVACVASTLLAVVAIDTYDVVVVGSGPGGLIAAEFLSRDPSIKVLVLEAGGPSLQASGGADVPDYAKSKGWTKFDIPGEYDAAGSIFAAENVKYMIDYTDDRKLSLGQLVGGCSSINAALYFRVPDAYLSQTSWPFDAAHVNKRYDEMESDVFGWTDTPSPDGKRYVQEAYDIVARALKKAGYSEKALNDAEARNNKHKSFGHAPFAIKGGLRDSPAKTCWGKMKSRGNVKLLTSARVSYVKQSKGKATGVVYNDNVEVAVSDRGTVVMAAGAIGTPKVLIQSGIGPSDQLWGLKGNSKFPGISGNFGDNGDGWVYNENVGRNLFDTTLALASFTHDQMNAFQFKNKPQDAISQYLQSQTGPLSTSGPVLIGYENNRIQDRLYEFQITILTSGLTDASTNNKAFGAALYINNPESRDRCSFDVSTGKYRSMTSNSLYMATNRDLIAMQDYTNRVVQMLQQEGASFVKKSGLSVNDWVAGNRGYVTHHFGGSCYVSKDSTDGSRCADDKLRVVGTSNIYVADASAMRDGTVNPYGFIMYTGREVGNIVKDAIASGPSTPATPPTPAGGCDSYQRENGVDYSGNDISNVKSASADGCCSICSATAGCNAYTWTNFNGGTCWLKSGKGKTSSNGGSISGVKKNATPSSSCPPLESNVDYTGADIGNAPSSTALGCCSICSARSGCEAFSWSNYNGGTCYLKRGKGQGVSKSGVTSGVIGGGSSGSVCGATEENVNYESLDMGSATASKAESCCEICQNRNGCGAYTWTNYNGGTCWLKTGKGATSKQSGARSAVVNRAAMQHHVKQPLQVKVTMHQNASSHSAHTKKARKHDSESIHVRIKVHHKSN